MKPDTDKYEKLKKKGNKKNVKIKERKQNDSNAEGDEETK